MSPISHQRAWIALLSNTSVVLLITIFTNFVDLNFNFLNIDIRQINDIQGNILIDFIFVSLLFCNSGWRLRIYSINTSVFERSARIFPQYLTIAICSLEDKNVFLYVLMFYVTWLLRLQSISYVASDTRKIMRCRQSSARLK